MKIIAYYIIIILITTNLAAQFNQEISEVNLEYRNGPTGFLGVKFGSSIDDAFNKLVEQGYEINNIKKFSNHIEVKNFILDDLSVDDAILKFNYENQMHYGKSEIKIISKKSNDESVVVYEKIKRSINQKYKKNTKNSSRLKAKDNKNYWSDSWEFKDKSNKNIIAEIKIWKDEKWINYYGDWQRESFIYMEYLSNFAPVNPKPSPGSLKDAL